MMNQIKKKYSKPTALDLGLGLGLKFGSDSSSLVRLGHFCPCN